MSAHSLVHTEAVQARRRRARRLLQLGWPQFLFLGGILGMLALVTLMVFLLLTSG